MKEKPIVRSDEAIETDSETDNEIASTEPSKGSAFAMTACGLSGFGVLAWFVWRNLGKLRLNLEVEGMTFEENVLFADVFLRVIILFAGLAFVFVGLATSYIMLTKGSRITAKSLKNEVNVATASPGIVAMVLGSLIIVVPLLSSAPLLSQEFLSDSKTDAETTVAEPGEAAADAKVDPSKTPAEAVADSSRISVPPTKSSP